MRRRQAAHPARTITAEAAAAMVTSGMWLDYGAVLSQPDLFDRALAARVTELHDVKIRSTISTRPRAVLEADPEGRHVYMISLHFSGYDRKMHDAGRCDYLPVNLGEIDDYYARYIDRSTSSSSRRDPPIPRAGSTSARRRSGTAPSSSARDW
jgi:acyl-CoA hydrolase